MTISFTFAVFRDLQKFLRKIGEPPPFHWADREKKPGKGPAPPQITDHHDQGENNGSRDSETWLVLLCWLWLRWVLSGPATIRPRAASTCGSPPTSARMRRGLGGSRSKTSAAVPIRFRRRTPFRCEFP